MREYACDYVMDVCARERCVMRLPSRTDRVGEK